MSSYQKRLAWRALAVQLLLGASGGLVALVASWLIFKALYALSFAVADRLDGWLAFGAFAVLLIISTALSGMAGGAAGSLLVALVAWRAWRPSRRRVVLWVLVWMLGGLVLWFGAVQAAGGDPALDLGSAWRWALHGLLAALGFALIVLPRHDRPPRH